MIEDEVIPTATISLEWTDWDGEIPLTSYFTRTIQNENHLKKAIKTIKTIMKDYLIVPETQKKGLIE